MMIAMIARSFRDSSMFRAAITNCVRGAGTNGYHVIASRAIPRIIRARYNQSLVAPTRDPLLAKHSQVVQHCLWPGDALFLSVRCGLARSRLVGVGRGCHRAPRCELLATGSFAVVQAGRCLLAACRRRSRATTLLCSCPVRLLLLLAVRPGRSCMAWPHYVSP